MNICEFFSPILEELTEQQKSTPEKLSFFDFGVRSGSHFPKFVVISSDSCLIDHFECLLREKMQDYIKYSLEKKKLFNLKLGVKLNDSELLETKEIIRNKIEKKLKRYSSLGNVVYSTNVAHKIKFKASSLDDAAEALRSLIYDSVHYYFKQNESIISVPFEDFLEERIKSFKDTVESNFPDWSSQIVLFERTGAAQLLTFFDKATQKTIHKNVGNFFLIYQENGSLRLEKAPVRKRRADNVFEKAVDLFDINFYMPGCYLVFAK